MRADRLDTYAKHGLPPSFFSNHVQYWGDVHYANLGPERATFISPLASAFKRGIRATNHTDATVTPLDPMFLLWTWANRVTREGRVLAEAERVTSYHGLRAVTVNGACEYFGGVQGHARSGQARLPGDAVIPALVAGGLPVQPTRRVRRPSVGRFQSPGRVVTRA